MKALQYSPGFGNGRRARGEMSVPQGISRDGHSWDRTTSCQFDALQYSKQE